MGSPRRVEAMDIRVILMSIASTLLGDPICFLCLYHVYIMVVFAVIDGDCYLSIAIDRLT